MASGVVGEDEDCGLLCVPESLMGTVDLPPSSSFVFQGQQENLILDCEIDEMISRRALEWTKERLRKDYGEKEANEIVDHFSTCPDLIHFLPPLNHYGVATRWPHYLQWSKLQIQEGREDFTPRTIFADYARSLGRVLSYRALALDSNGLKKILEEDSIFSSGRLRVKEEVLSDILATHGVRKVAVARLYISQLQSLIGYDPSLSLHDDWQTTTAIASGYAEYDRLEPERSKKKIFLFEVSVPLIEVLGWTLKDVQDRREDVLPGFGRKDEESWFLFPSPAVPQGIWFDGENERTERYGFFGVPFLKQRLKRLLFFKTLDNVRSSLAPFVSQQISLKAEHQKEKRKNGSQKTNKQIL